MASDTAPAAVPGPHDPPPSTAPATLARQQASGMAGLLAPIESTRAAFTLDPDPAAETVGLEQAVTDANSSTVAPDNTTADSDGNSSKSESGKQKQSVIRAWMLAGAERWKKGADARNKRLDIQKARAQAVQVKETRQVSLNRTGGLSSFGPGKGTGNSGGGKSLNRKNSPNGSAVKGPKNSGGTSRTGSGNTPSSGRSHNAGPAKKPQDARADRPKTPHRDHTSSGKGRDRRPDKPKNDRGHTDSRKTPTADRKPTSSGGGSSHSGGKSGGQGSAGKPGKDTPPADKTGPKNSSKHTPGSAVKSDSKDRPWKDPARKPRQDKEPAGTSGRDGSDRNARTKTDTSKKPAPGNTAAKNNPTTDHKPTSKTKDTNTGPGKDPRARLNPARPTDTRTPRPRINLQTSREAGYRDGTRAAKTAAHARAWRDGVRDGYRDTTQAAARETARLDQAHNDRKTARTTEATTVPQTAATTVPPQPDHAPGPQPVPVTSIDATHIHLGTGAGRSSISRGEVRTLRNFQQRLTDKNERMTAVAEATRTLAQHAREQAKQVTELLEQARAVQGGDKVVAALNKLADAAQVQETKAADIHQRAARSADACQALTANTETRYGDIYQAVVDSPETSPAELAYYQDMETASV